MSHSPLETWNALRTIPSDTAIGAQLAEEVAREMVRRDWPRADVFRVQLAFDEAIVNAIRHGNRFDPNKTVDVEIQCNCESIHIRIADQGKGFDPRSIPDPRETDNLELPGGRGVLLISELMSDVQYNERCSEIRMTKIKSTDPDEDDR